MIWTIGDITGTINMATGFFAKHFLPRSFNLFAICSLLISKSIFAPLMNISFSFSSSIKIFMTTFSPFILARKAKPKEPRPTASWCRASDSQSNWGKSWRNRYFSELILPLRKASSRRFWTVLRTIFWFHLHVAMCCPWLPMFFFFSWFTVILLFEFSRKYT